MTDFGKEFIRLIKEGFECFFRYQGQVYFYSLTYRPDERDPCDMSKWEYMLRLRTVEENPRDDVDVWHDVQVGEEPLEKFLEAKLFGGKTIIDIADDIEWANEYF